MLCGMPKVVHFVGHFFVRRKKWEAFSALTAAGKTMPFTEDEVACILADDIW